VTGDKRRVLGSPLVAPYLAGILFIAFVTSQGLLPEPYRAGKK